MINLDKSYDPLAWGSHLAPLMACVARTTGPILEIGIGHFSTPVLHAVSCASGRVMVSVEDDESWLNFFSRRYENKLHSFMRGPYSEAFNHLYLEQWGVVFIDHSPGGQNRAEAFEFFKKLSDYVVVHDYHDENERAIKPLLEGMNHGVYCNYEPPTLVASCRKNVTDCMVCK